MTNITDTFPAPDSHCFSVLSPVATLNILVLVQLRWPVLKCPASVRRAWDELQLRGRPLLAHGTTGVATVAGKLNRPFRIFTVLATVSPALANPTITRRMFTFPGLVMHGNPSYRRQIHSLLFRLNKFACRRAKRYLPTGIRYPPITGLPCFHPIAMLVLPRNGLCCPLSRDH